MQAILGILLFGTLLLSQVGFSQNCNVVTADTFIVVSGETSVVDPIANDSIVNPIGQFGLVDTSTVATIQFLNPATLVYTAHDSFSGIDSLFYFICDSCGCDTTNLVFMAQPPNQAPTAQPDTIHYQWNSIISLNPFFNDFDLEGDSIFICGWEEPVFGQVDIHPNNSIIYVPWNNYAGIDSMNYYLCSNNGDTSVGTIYIIVPQYLVPDKSTTQQGFSVSINPFDNDFRFGNSLVPIFGQPKHGSVLPLGGNEYQYIPVTAFVGYDTIQYQSCGSINGIDVQCDTSFWCIEVIPSAEIIVAGGISPNGDGKNETFVIQGIQNFPGSELQIFNRWGDLVWNNDVTAGYQNDFNGTSKDNGQLPDGTYFYVLRVNSAEPYFIQGSLEINR